MLNLTDLFNIKNVVALLNTFIKINSNPVAIRKKFLFLKLKRSYRELKYMFVSIHSGLAAIAKKGPIETTESVSTKPPMNMYINIAVSLIRSDLGKEFRIVLKCI